MASSQQIPPEDQKLEVTIIRAIPKRLPSGFNCCLIINIYIPEFTETKQRKLIFHLNEILIEPVITNHTKNGKPLLYIAGDFNNANNKYLYNTFNVYQVNSKPTNKNNDKCLDILLTNAPKCYVTKNQPPFGNSDHELVIAIPPLHKYKITRPVQIKVAK